MSQFVSYIFVAVAVILLIMWMMRRSSRKRPGGR